jgi:hypothetical protein
MASLVNKLTFSMNIVDTRCASSIAIVVVALNHYKSWLSDRPITAITLVMNFYVPEVTPTTARLRGRSIRTGLWYLLSTP